MLWFTSSSTSVVFSVLSGLWFIIVIMATPAPRFAVWQFVNIVDGAKLECSLCPWSAKHNRNTTNATRHFEKIEDSKRRTTHTPSVNVHLEGQCFFNHGKFSWTDSGNFQYWE